MRTVWYDTDLGPQLAADDEAIADKPPQSNERILDARQLDLDVIRQQRLMSWPIPVPHKLQSGMRRRMCTQSTRLRALERLRERHAGCRYWTRSQ